MIHHIPESLFGNTVQLHGVRFIHRVEQRWKGIAQIEAATTSVADIEYPLQFFKQGRLIVKLGIFPVQRMPLRGFKATFTTTFYRCRHFTASLLFTSVLRFQGSGFSAAAGQKTAGQIEKETNSSPRSSQRTLRKKI
jgi:hypothetical protein